MTNLEKLRFREKMSYGFGDLASSMFWKLFSMFLLFFHTDVFGITAAANDPLTGMIADRIKSRWATK